MHEKSPQSLPDGYRRPGNSPIRQNIQKKVTRNNNSNNSSMSAIEKYRSTLNLPTTNGKNSSKQNRSKITISDQTARLIALSIKGLLNS